MLCRSILHFILLVYFKTLMETNAAPVHSALDVDIAESAEDAFQESSGDDHEIDAYELQKILNKTFSKGVNIQMVTETFNLVKNFNSEG